MEAPKKNLGADKKISHLIQLRVATLDVYIPSFHLDNCSVETRRKKEKQKKKTKRKSYENEAQNEKSGSSMLPYSYSITSNIGTANLANLPNYVI